MARSYPRLGPLKELRHALGEMRLEELAVGPDGRNRTLLSPFGARSGRNTPSNTRFVFGPSVWMRGLIKPEPGRALAYIDWSSQEVAIAAVLSNDRAMLAAVDSGDPYLAFAKMAGLAPGDATRETHGAVRDQCKACVLGVQYGMGARSLATRIGVSELEARELLRRMARTFPGFWAWSEHTVDVAHLTDHAYTVLGWPLHGARGAKSTTLKNFPMQGNGAEMLRLACCLATEAGVQVVAPVHDALMIEAAVDELAAAVATTREAMARASRTILAGFEIATDATIVIAPDRYSDPRGAVMWQRVTELLDQVRTAAA
jgi:DNA polymerase I-like protein with 3'-5' exonuclease and polymerase domains